MGEIEKYTFDTSGVRVIIEDGDPWFVLRDVCEILGLSNPTQTARHLDSDDLSTTEVIDSIGRTQRANTVNEAGLYQVIFLSRKEEARKFRRWVTSEVLPQIRKTGAYGAGPQPPRTMLEALRAAVESEEARLVAEVNVARLEPLAETAERLLESKGSISVADAAKVLTRAGVVTGQNRLFRSMAELRWLFRRDNEWHPYQEAIERGYVITTPRTHAHPKTGEIILDSPKITVTAKGLQALEKQMVTEA